jgi:phospholipase C
VPPPACTPDGFVAQPGDTQTGKPFLFDRLGVRVPAILVSPWVQKRTVVPGLGAPGGRVFEHASIPATITKLFIGDYDNRSVREKRAETFLDLLTLDQMRTDTPDFDLG